MSVLSWGKPTVEFGKLGAANAAPTTWTTLPEIKENTAILSTEQGAAVDAIEEGGGLVDRRRAANKYSFTLQLFVKKGDTKPIEDMDGVIDGNYAVRLTPEDSTNNGWIMDKTSVSSQLSWSSADGELWTYTFDGVKPKTGNVVKPYTAVAP